MSSSWKRRLSPIFMAGGETSHPLRVLKRVDLPALGSPTMAMRLLPSSPTSAPTSLQSRELTIEWSSALIPSIGMSSAISTP